MQKKKLSRKLVVSTMASGFGTLGHRMMGPNDDEVIEEGTTPVVEMVPDTAAVGHGSCCEVAKEEESSQEDLCGHGWDAQEQGQEGTECDVHVMPRAMTAVAAVATMQA